MSLETGSKIYRMMSKIFSPSRLWANRLLPQWLGERHWKLAPVFTVRHRHAFAQSLQRIFFFFKWCVAQGRRAYQIWQLTALGNRMKTHRGCDSDISDACWRYGCVVYCDIWADLDCWKRTSRCGVSAPISITQTFSLPWCAGTALTGSKLQFLSRMWILRSTLCVPRLT